MKTPKLRFQKFSQIYTARMYEARILNQVYLTSEQEPLVIALEFLMNRMNEWTHLQN